MLEQSMRSHVIQEIGMRETQRAINSLSRLNQESSRDRQRENNAINHVNIRHRNGKGRRRETLNSAAESGCGASNVNAGLKLQKLC